MKLPMRAAWAAVALIVLAGCGGGSDSDGPEATKPPTSAAPTTAAPTTPAAGERPADDKSDAGAIDFSEFVVNRIVGVTSGANVDDVLTLASADCSGCIKLAQDRQKAGTVKQEFDEPAVISDAKVADTSDDGTQYLVEQVLELSTGRKIDTATGQTTETFDEPTRLAVTVLMTWKNDKWQLTNYSSKKAS